MRIVTYVHRPKRRPKTQPPALTGAVVVKSIRKRGPKPPVELKEDPEADARVAAWFARNVRPAREPNRER
jgi:hypothetical protein